MDREQISLMLAPVVVRGVHHQYVGTVDVPLDDDQNVYFVVDDLGRLDQVWRTRSPQLNGTKTTEFQKRLPAWLRSWCVDVATRRRSSGQKPSMLRGYVS
jgi:hypothetical protein